MKRFFNWLRGHLVSVGLVVMVLALLAVSVWSIGFRGDSDGGEGSEPQVNSTPPIGEAPTAVPNDCEPGTGEWALDESLHGEGGRILNGGLPADTQAAVDVILAASRQDPLVLGQLLLDYGVEGVPSKAELRCVDVRRDWWNRLEVIFQVSEIEMRPLGDFLGELGITANGNSTVTVSNSMVVGGNVSIVESNVNVGENVLAVTPPGAKEPVLHRSYCANVIVKPGEEVRILPPGPTPTPVPTPPPSATPTPTPRATPTPTPTPTRTPPPTRTPTPAPDFGVTIIGIEKQPNVNRDWGSFQASLQFEGWPVEPYSITWYLDGVVIGHGTAVEHGISLGVHHGLRVVVVDALGRTRSDTADVYFASEPPSPGNTPTPTATAIPQPTPPYDPGDGYCGPGSPPDDPDCQ